MRRTSQLVGLDFSTGRAISPLPVNPSVAKAQLIFMMFRELRPTRKMNRSTRVSPLRVRKAPLASLGNRTAIENKTHRIHGGLSESIEIPDKSQYRNRFVLTRQKCGRSLGVLSLLPLRILTTKRYLRYMSKLRRTRCATPRLAPS
jgi:hypothetical protein